jgi:hypothetical protein
VILCRIPVAPLGRPKQSHYTNIAVHLFCLPLYTPHYTRISCSSLSPFHSLTYFCFGILFIKGTVSLNCYLLFLHYLIPRGWMPKTVSNLASKVVKILQYPPAPRYRYSRRLMCQDSTYIEIF